MPEVEKVATQQKATWGKLAKEGALKWICWPRLFDNTEEFFESGKKEVQTIVLPFFQKQGFEPSGKRMLDIGCGAGRTTRFFSEIFAEAYGVDISEEMINQGKSWNEDRPTSTLTLVTALT